MSNQSTTQSLVVLKQDGTVNKSQSIRKMDRAGMTKGAIAKELGIRYQFVYNVLNQQTKDEPEVPETPTTEVTEKATKK